MGQGQPKSNPCRCTVMTDLVGLLFEGSVCPFEAKGKRWGSLT